MYVATRFEPPAQPAYDELIQFIAERHRDSLFSLDGSTVDEQVAELLGLRKVAVAESCTGGLMAARLTDRPGSSDYFAGGIVAYSNEAKSSLVGVDPALIDRVGAVSLARRISGTLLTEADGLAPISVSIGTAAFPADGSTAEELLAAADREMYAEKRQRAA